MSHASVPFSASLTRRAFLKQGTLLFGATSLLATSSRATGPAPEVKETRRADLIVWDSTPGGLIAAIAAARGGLKALVVTEDVHLGAMQTSGLGFTNAGQRETIGGLTAEFHQRILRHYVKKYGADSVQVKDSSDGYFFEPHVAESIYVDWLREAGVTCLANEALDSIELRANRIVAIRTAGGQRLEGRIFVDASYEGDLLKLARCSYHLGREARATYGEAFAGTTYPADKAGLEDHKLQPFDYRMCLTDAAANRVPFTEPAGYDPEQFAYDLYRMRIQPPTTFQNIQPLNWMPNRKTDSRTAQWPGASWDYIEANAQRRREIDRAHQRRCASYLWFAMTDSRVPAVVREDAARFGLAKDEFTDNGNWPYHIYIREGRRLVGDFVMTQRDCIEDRFKSDSVGLCSWYLDVHPVELIPLVDGFHRDGAFNVPVKPFEIPYRALLPKSTEAENLLVPVALSASHVAFSSIRVEPVWMILGQAAGLAAALSLETGRPLHSISVDQLRKTLTEQGQVIDARPFNESWPANRGPRIGSSPANASQEIRGEV